MASSVSSGPVLFPPMPTTLYDLLPRDENLSGDNLLGRFLDYVEARRLTLYPAQEEAVLENITWVKL